ncbi:hypothetical protein EVAR_47084_1 [Eumeta japonica]|uniref:RNA-directed DNA polymerase from mobile element jockey n=1 Tax=Eumeta variegata TaxID=151549 RepID=A0A4C1Y955_EUMVA|nr:hypothetical protein EVAR_47084_1 [Eumeta japonica]
MDEFSESATGTSQDRSGTYYQQKKVGKDHAGSWRATNHIELFIRYLGVMIDARLNFKQRVEHVSAKASVVRASLARLMPNVRGPKQSRRWLLLSVVTSILTYEISIWADALEIQEAWRKPGPVYPLSALRVASAFRTISEQETVCVISGTLPLRVLAVERRVLYHRKRSTALSAEKLSIEERQNSISQ